VKAKGGGDKETKKERRFNKKKSELEEIKEQ
jgi:hypothetical protein